MVSSAVPKTSMWEYLTTVRLNPVNLKCQTLPILSLRNQYSRNFHLYVFSSYPLLYSQLTQFVIPARGLVSG
jgi:hypothetical protein